MDFAEKLVADHKAAMAAGQTTGKHSSEATCTGRHKDMCTCTLAHIHMYSQSDLVALARGA